MNTALSATARSSSRHVALVTGAASGIGLAVVETLLASEFRVCATDLQPSALERLKPQYDDSRLLVMAMDVTDDAAIKRVAVALEEKWEGANLLVNSAGVFEQTPLLTLQQSTMLRILDVNLCGTLRCMACFGAGMERRGGGRIINIGSVSGERGAALAAVYAASKAGVAAVTRSAARELASKGIIVAAISPGLCDTPMLDPQRALINKFILPRVPLNRLATPREVAELVLFLATCETTYFNGAVISFDGGGNVG